MKIKHEVIFGILYCFGLFSSVFGLYYISTKTYVGALHCGVWFIFVGISHLLGLVSIILGLTTTEDEVEQAYQIHDVHICQFLCGWFAIVLGYPMIVSYTWLKTFHKSKSEQLVMLFAIPFAELRLIGQYPTPGAIKAGQIIIGLAVTAHFIICYMFKEWMGLSVAGTLVVANILFNSIPTRKRIKGLAGFQCALIVICVTTLLMNFAIYNLETNY